ncbi:MAG: argininosuccinate synthase [Tidjanibacter sp.]|nr:argininosuccinate synthase [Tidjanibacter sp.]
MEKVVLAYSGGLDTSFCVKYLQEELHLEVYTALANTGGFSQEELDTVEKKAYALGAKKHVTLDITEEYYDKCIKYMVFGNVLRNKTYPISVSSERTFQALAIVNYAKEIGAQYIAHGSTGAGNDQVRFDLCFDVFAPEIKIITPTRDLKLSREYEIDYLKQHGFEADFKKMEYSINKGLWGTSVGGKETLVSSTNIPDEAYPSQLKKDGSEMLEIEFCKGEVCAVNGKKMQKVEAIREIERIGNEWAIGRDTHLGDTLVGIKGRVAFEAAAPMLIIKSHELLEKHTLTKWQTYWKEQLGNWYGMFVHEAMYSEPVMRDIEKFLENSQRNVSGKVFIKLRPYTFFLVGAESDHDLMNSGFAEYGEVNNAWTADDVKGFTKILGMPLKIYNFVNKDEE